jgi:hypothetical protein
MAEMMALKQLIVLWPSDPQDSDTGQRYNEPSNETSVQQVDPERFHPQALHGSPTDLHAPPEPGWNLAGAQFDLLPGMQWDSPSAVIICVQAKKQIGDFENC